MLLIKYNSNIIFLCLIFLSLYEELSVSVVVGLQVRHIWKKYWRLEVFPVKRNSC